MRMIKGISHNEEMGEKKRGGDKSVRWNDEEAITGKATKKEREIVVKRPHKQMRCQYQRMEREEVRR